MPKSAAMRRDARRVILESLYASITDSLLVLDSDLVIVDANEPLLKRLGKTHDEAIGHPWAVQFPHLVDMGRAYDLHSVMAGGRPHQGRIPLICADGQTTALFDVTTYPVRDPKTGEVTHLIEYAREVTEEVRLQLEIMDANKDLMDIKEQLEAKSAEIDLANRLLAEKCATLEVVNEWLGRVAVLDMMTDLPNHRGFQEQLTYETHQAAQHKRPFSLLLLDVDNFKRYNDAYGHPQGDTLLAHLAQIMREVIRVTDLPARYGGEEFAILLPETDKDGATRVAERLRAAVAAFPFESCPVTISIGIAEFPTDASDANALVRCADRAMYESKARGKNRASLWNRAWESANPLPRPEAAVSSPFSQPPPEMPFAPRRLPEFNGGESSALSMP